MLNDIAENRLIASLVQSFRRSPLQANGLHETDAEIVRIRDRCTIAISTDSIAEEVALGLYADPWLIGWMAVMANLSDLAAVGAEPLGVVVSEILPRTYSDLALRQLQQGIRDACDHCSTYVLGGDTNSGERLTITGTAIGLCPEGKYLSRIGCRPGDLLFVTNAVGGGNAFALSALFPPPAAGPEPDLLFYRPVARIREGLLLRDLASSCMDTSDGVITCLDQLMRLNRVGFELADDWINTLHSRARQQASALGIPPWLFLAGQHGEFELLYTVPKHLADQVSERSSALDRQPLLLGRVVPEPGITLTLDGERAILDTARIRNIAESTGTNVERYLTELLAMNNEMQEGEPCN